MSTEVGRGHITVDVNIDEQGIVRSSQRVAQRAAKMFGDDYSDKVQASLRAADRHFDVHINRNIASFQNLEKQRIASMESTNRRILALQREIASATERDRSLSDAYAKEGKRAADAFAAEQNKSFSKIADSYRRGLASLEADSSHTSRRIGQRFETDIDHHSRRGSSLLERHLRGAFDGVLSLLPSRLEFLFTRTGPIIGTSLMVGLAGSIAIGAPALGAMFTGLFAASLGVGAAIAAIFVGIADDNRVLNAARRIRENFLQEVIYHPDMQNIGQVLADQLDKVNDGLDRWAPHIQSILQAGARFLPGITDGLIGMVDAILPNMDRFLNSQFMKDIMDIVSGGLKQLGEAFGVSLDRLLADPQAMEGAKKGLQDIFDLAAASIKLIFDILRGLARAWEDLNKDPDGPGPDISKLQAIRDLWKEIRILIGEIVQLGQEFDRLFGGSIGGPSGDSSGKFSGFKGELQEISAQIAAINSVIEQSKVIWEWYRTNPIQIILVLQAMITDFLENVKTRWNEAWGNVKLAFTERWADITITAANMWNIIWAIFTSWIEGVKKRWNESWGDTKQFFIDRWTELSAFATQAWNMFTTMLGTWLDGIKQRWNDSWGNFKQFFIDRWEDIKTAGSNALGILAGLIDGAMKNISDGWNRWWGGIWGAVVGIWNNITTSVQGGINSVIDLINKGIGLINGLLQKLGVSFQITPIGHVGGVTTPQPLPGMANFSRMATGGPIHGPGSGTSDSVPILASNGEFMINAKSTKKWYHLIRAINNDSLPGFVDGGYIGMFNWIKQRVPGVSLASGYRAGDPGYHGKGMAVDLIFSDGSERRGGGMAGHAFALIKAAFMPIIRELIWDFAGGQAVWNGRNHFFTGSSAGPGTHDDHIHWAQGGGGGGGLLSGLFEWLGKGWNALVSELIDPVKNQVLALLPANNALMGMGRGWVNAVMDQVIAKVKVEFDQAMEAFNSLGAAGDFNGSAGGAQRWSGVAQQALKMLGLPGSWLGPLLTLIQRESGGNPSAINRWDSNAAKGQPSQGLMQTIPSTFNAFKFPGYNNILAPLDNILAGLRYIISKYGSIFNVQQANSRMSPAGYDSGGWMMPGQMGINTSSRPEPVFTGSQWDAIRNGNGGVNVTVYVDGVKRDARAVVEENNLGLINAANRGRTNG